MKSEQRFIITLLLLITAISGLSAQTKVTGVIRDAKTKEPVIGANVIIKELQKGTISDGSGSYKFVLPRGTYTFVFSSMGYESQSKKITCNKDQTTLNVKLKESITQLDEIIITAKSEAREVREQATPVSVITVDEIQGTVSNVSELLTKTSGIKIRSSGGAGSAQRISVRGLEGKRVGSFINGMPINDQSDFVSFNDIPLDLIERIEVYKGIVPAKFGGSAVGGAINIVIKEFPPKYIDVGYSLQSYNTHNATLVFKRNNTEKGYEFGGGGFYSYSDNNYTFSLNDPDYDIKNKKRDHDAFKKIAVAGNFTAKKWWFDEIEFEPVYISTKKEIQGITENIQEAVTYSDAFLIANTIEKEDLLIKGLDFDFSLAYAYTIFKYQDKSMQRYNWDGTTYEPVTILGGEIGTTPNDSYNQKHTILQKTNLNYIINENSSINLNGVYNYAYGIPEDTLKDAVIGYKSNFNSTMNSYVSGLNYELDFFNHKFTNSATIKHYYYSVNTTLIDIYSHDHEEKPHDLNKSDFGFSNAIRYRFTPEFLVKASFAYDVRLPSENELLGDGFITVPAGDLEPERNTNVNIGFMYDRTNVKNNRFQFEINFFYTYLENMIRFTGSFLQSKYENFGEMESRGMDIDIKYDLTSFLYVYANGTYQDLRDARKKEPGSSEDNPTYGDRMPNIPYLYTNAGFELHEENLFGGINQESKFYFENSFVEEYFYNFEQSVHQKKRIPRSITYNLGLEHSFKNKNIIIGLQVNNITDEEMITIFNRPMPGRTAGIKLRYIIR